MAAGGWVPGRGELLVEARASLFADVGVRPGRYADVEFTPRVRLATGRRSSWVDAVPVSSAERAEG
jgi:hypothetical protein